MFSINLRKVLFSLMLFILIIVPMIRIRGEWWNPLSWFEKVEKEEIKIKYTPTTRTICQNNLCTKTLYSGIQNVYEDGVWKDVQDARSLKGSGVECVIDSDEKHYVECLDWNYTHKVLKLSIDNNKEVGKDIPLKSFRPTLNEQTGKDELIKVKEQSYRFNSLQENNVLIYESGYKDVIHFGENSTTITLQDNETENLLDGEVQEGSPSANCGAYTSMETNVQSNYDEHSYITFNISSISDLDISVENASLNLYVISNNLGPVEENRLSHILQFLSDDDGLTINETQFTFTDSPCGDYHSGGNSTYCNMSHYVESPVVVGSDIDIWVPFDVTDYVNRDCQDSKGNTSFIVFGTGYGKPGFATKEYAVTSERPYLNITYYLNYLPTSTLIEPEDNLIDETSSVSFICSATDNKTNIQNVSLYGNWTGSWVLNETNSSGLTGNYTFSKEMGNGNYIWNCLVCQDDNNCSFADSNFSFELATFNLNIIGPTTENPLNTSNSSEISVNFTYQKNGVNLTTGIDLESVLIDNTLCEVIETGSYSVSVIDFEDFEGYSEGTQPNPIGNWSQASFDTDDWYVYTGNGESSSTGPTTDYDGYYAMVETSAGNCNNPDTAVLYRSPSIDFDSYSFVNVSFAYNMYGSTMGTLHIKENSTGDWVSKWSESGDHGTDWFEENQNLSGLSGVGNIAIWMDCGSSYTSDGAVDSVNITGTTSTEQEFAYLGDYWQVNVSVPDKPDGTYDLYLNATYEDFTKDETESSSIVYGEGGGEEDSCTCPGDGENWEIDLGDSCSIQDDCDLGVGNLTFTGTGSDTLLNSTINALNFEPPSGQRIWVGQALRLLVGSLMGVLI